MKNIDDIYELLRQIPVTKTNKPYIDEIEDLLTQQEYIKALEKMRRLKDVTNDENEGEFKLETEKNEEEEIYPEKLNGTQLEYDFIGILLSNPKLIMKYYFSKEICLFKDEQCLNIYKSILFNEGAQYASEKAKDGFNFSKDSEEVYNLKAKLKKQAEDEQKNPEKIYVELRKIFILRKSCLEAPERYIQDKIAEITDYQLYDKMSPEEIEDAITQVNVTQKFKQSILSRNLVRFLESGENELANGLDYPFPILTQVFKGIRKGETMAFAMPSNSGKSRLTIDIAAYTSLVHQKKVLVISNEMSEEKMKLCLITTILNNPEIQKIHGKRIYNLA